MLSPQLPLSKVDMCTYHYYNTLLNLVSSYTDPTLKLRTFNAHIQELQHLVTSQSAPLPYLDHINTHLHNAVLACRAAIQAEKTSYSSTFPKPDKIPATKKPEHQWRFQHTTKTPGRKRSGLVLRYCTYMCTYYS